VNVLTLQQFGGDEDTLFSINMCTDMRQAKRRANILRTPSTTI